MNWSNLREKLEFGRGHCRRFSIEKDSDFAPHSTFSYAKKFLQIKHSNATRLLTDVVM